MEDKIQIVQLGFEEHVLLWLMPTGNESYNHFRTSVLFPRKSGPNEIM